jgi:SAM-dependent methyltransferase
MDAALWDAIAKVERRHWWFRGRRELVASVLGAHLRQGARILDVGCGTGFVLERLLDEYDAWGLEPDPGVRARAGERVRGRILAGSTEDTGAVGTRRFDAILLLDVLEHLDDDVAALTAVAPLLDRGGIVLATVPAYPALWSSHDVRNAHRRRYTKPALRRTLAGAGFAVDLLSHINARLFPMAMLHRLGAGTLGRRTDRELAVPPHPINELFTRLFAGEARGVRRGYPFGLSLIAVAHRA